MKPAHKATSNDDWALIIFAIAAVGYIEQRLHLASLVAYLLIASLVIFILGVLALLGVAFRRKQHQLQPEQWDEMSGRKFEDQIVLWLKQCGYTKVRKTEYFDQGIDIIAAQPGKILGVQVKRSSRPVGVNAVRAAVAGLKSYGCTQAMVVTNSSFTPAATRLAEANDCLLRDGLALKESLEQIQ